MTEERIIGVPKKAEVEVEVKTKDCRKHGSSEGPLGLRGIRSPYNSWKAADGTGRRGQQAEEAVGGR